MLIAQDLHSETLSLALQPEGRSLQIRLTDHAAGREWGPVPLLALEVYDKPLKRVERVTDWRVERVDPIADGVAVRVCDPNRGIEITLALCLTAGELSAVLAPGAVCERDPAMYRLFAVDLLPGLMRVRNGTLLLPINSGLLCPTAGAPAVRDRFLIYGEQERWELTPSLPVCAAADGQSGLVALARQGACDAECRVETDGSGAGSAGFAFSLRRYWIDPVDPADREVRLAPVPVESDLTAFCARRLRRHVMQDLGKRTLRERADESPEVAYLLDAYIMKLFHGIQNTGYMMAGQGGLAPGAFVSYLTFAEARHWLRKIRDAGIGKVLTQCTGWNIGGHDGLYPTRFPVEERLGGEAGFREMIRSGNDLGFHMQVHDNFIMTCAASPDYDPDLVTRDLFGEPLVHGRWAGGIEYSGWPLAYPPERLAGHMEKMKGFGLRGMCYVDYMEQPLEVNYHPRHGGPRSACARGQQRVIEEGRRVFGSCGTEFGFLPAAIPADHISTCGDPWHLTMCKPDWPIVALIDRNRVVPLWQMAMSGLVVLEARGHVAWGNAMEAVLYGRAPRDEWGQRAGPLPAIDDRRIAALKAIYDLCVTRFGHLKLLEIASYRTDGDGIKETRFSDGTTVTADFKRQSLHVNNELISRPLALSDPNPPG